jgi:PAS domain S-box-containing protein
MGGHAIAAAHAYAREIRKNIVALSAVAVVTAAGLGLLAWHHINARHVRDGALFRHYAALAAIETLEKAALGRPSGGAATPVETEGRMAQAIRRLRALEADDPAKADLAARIEAGWAGAGPGAGRADLLAALQSLEAGHVDAAEALSGAGGDAGDDLPWRTVLPVVALVGAGGLAAHRLARRINRAADGQRAVEDSLRAGEAGHARAQAIAGLGHWSWDMATDKVVRSDEGYRILGRTPETLGDSIGDFLEVVHPEDRAAFQARVRGASEGREPYAQEFRVVWPDGTVRHVHSRAEVCLDPATGAPTGMVGTVLDITDRKAAEEALRASERRFRQIFDNAAFGIGMGDIQDRVIEVNAAFARFTGYAPDELRGRHFAELCHPEDLTSYRALVEQARTGTTGTIERRYLRKDGSTAWGRLTLAPIRDGQGPHEYAIGIVEDIGARRRMEAALQEREELLRQVAESIDEVFWLKDAGGARIYYVSPAFEAIFGLPMASLYENPHVWQEMVHPDDRPGVVATLERARRCGEPYAGRYRIRRPDGSERVIHGRGYPVRDADGNLFRWAGVAADVTELHRLEGALLEKEQRLREVTENIGEVFWIADVDAGRMTYVSPAFEVVWGRPCEEVYRDPQAWFAAVHPDDRAGLAAAIAAATRAGETAETHYRIVRPDGAERYIRDRGHPVRDADGKVRRFVGVATDVTEQRAAEEDRHRYQEELAHVTRLATMGQMASELAHEINQPLTAIANYAQGSIRRIAAGTGPVDEGLLTSLEQIAGQAARAGAIVRHLRELVVKGRSHRTVEDINVLVAAAARLLEPEARRHGVRLRLDLREGLDPVEVDRIQVDQVVINLTTNAIEALSERPGTREVVLSTGGGAGRPVTVAVADNGPGLPAEDRERLFGPFFTTKPHGLGMGLAIGRSIVEAHGGELVAEPGPNGGAVFRFSVPQAREAQDA